MITKERFINNCKDYVVLKKYEIEDLLANTTFDDSDQKTKDMVKELEKSFNKLETNLPSLLETSIEGFDFDKFVSMISEPSGKFSFVRYVSGKIDSNNRFFVDQKRKPKWVEIFNEKALNGYEIPFKCNFIIKDESLINKYKNKINQDFANFEKEYKTFSEKTSKFKLYVGYYYSLVQSIHKDYKYIMERDKSVYENLIKQDSKEINLSEYLNLLVSINRNRISMNFISKHIL